ncbi:hypothetical protein KP509_12G060700 [Ceratopteris richardii]|uniref:Pentatricopeptide repeat-containing protein n=1 Tax=Ceratopteris richardii TaxID=49495 RepID=A0A8T2TM37_CERRI|nr:hypothetical protein KP509_12G060700 [Ceratopteris richardii]
MAFFSPCLRSKRRSCGIFEQCRGKHTKCSSIMKSTEHTYASALRFYASSKNLINGMCLHAHMIRHELDYSSLLGNLLIQMYGECGAVLEASAVFNFLHEKDHFAWNFLIRSHAVSSSPAKSFHLFHRMLLEAILPDRYILVGILSACVSIDYISIGKMLHSRILGSPFEGDAVIATAFVNMYAKCGSIDDAQKCFSKLLEEDVVSYNAMISALGQAGDIKSSLWLFNKMQQQSLLPDRVTFLNVFSACAGDELLVQGKRLHSQCFVTEFKGNIALETALVNMYGKCHSVDDAQKTFDMMLQHDVVSWNALISVYAQHKDINGVLCLFERMHCEGIKPDHITFLCIIDACSNEGIILDKDWIHSYLQSTEAGLNMEVQVALMSMYSNCGKVQEAWEIFNAAPNQNISFWNSLLATLVKNQKFNEIFQVVADMCRHDVMLNRSTYVTLLDACASWMNLVEGMLLHTYMIEGHYDLDSVMSTNIINMYSKCGSMEDAFKVFIDIHDPNVVSWNVVISGYAENLENWKVMHLSRQMLQEAIIPNDITILCILNACSSQDFLGFGKMIHTYILGNESRTINILETAMVNVYGKCGNTSSALKVFGNLFEKDTVSWSSMISAFIHGADMKKAVLLFTQMVQEGALPDAVTYSTILCAFEGEAVLSQGKQVHASIVAAGSEKEVIVETALICMYCRCNRFNEAMRLFSERRDRNVACWNALMSGLAQSGQGIKAFQLYEQMQQEGVLPDSLTYVSILDACCSGTSLAKGHQIHSSAAACSLIGDPKVETALVSMYAKCGSLDNAEMMFVSGCSHSNLSWTAIITANAQHGHGKNALILFKRMLDEGHVPNKAVLVSIFSACSHAGLIDDLKELLGFLNSKMHVSVGVDLYNCLIDLLSRAGRLDEAEALINSMQEDPNTVSWTTLLGACKSQFDIERAERAALKLLKFDSQNPEPYVALSNIYAAASMHKMDMFQRIRKQVS